MQACPAATHRRKPHSARAAPPQHTIRRLWDTSTCEKCLEPRTSCALSNRPFASRFKRQRETGSNPTTRSGPQSSTNPHSPAHPPTCIRAPPHSGCGNVVRKCGSEEALRALSHAPVRYSSAKGQVTRGRSGDISVSQPHSRDYLPCWQGDGTEGRLKAQPPHAREGYNPNPTQPEQQQPDIASAAQCPDGARLVDGTRRWKDPAARNLPARHGLAARRFSRPAACHLAAGWPLVGRPPGV